MSLRTGIVNRKLQSGYHLAAASNKLYTNTLYYMFLIEIRNLFT